jgi:hypothetical protein
MKKEWCEYKEDWVKPGILQSREISARKKYRCPICNKRLYPSIRNCVGGEFVGFKLPRHKAK